MRKIKAGMDDEMIPGLDQLSAGLSDDIGEGLAKIHGGLGVDVSGGLGSLIDGFTRTEAVSGESGIIEGLTLIREGISNPEFSPNPGGDPGVSEALGMVITGLEVDVQDGVSELKGGVTGKILPGLQKIQTGISGEMQPGLSKLSVLFTIIWAASLIVILLVGIAIGRARKKDAPSRSASA
jgi:hypothetical protein